MLQSFITHDDGQISNCRSITQEIHKVKKYKLFLKNLIYLTKSNNFPNLKFKRSAHYQAQGIHTVEKEYVLA